MADESVLEALGILANAASNIYATQAEAEWRANQSELDRKHETNQMYLSNSLNMLSTQIAEKNKWKQEASKIGLTDLELTKVDPINQSGGSKNVIQTQLGTVVNNLNQANSEVEALANDVGNYYKGIGLGKVIDRDISGTISMTGAGNELESFMGSPEGSRYADLLNPDSPNYSQSMMLGLQNYTLSAESQVQLQTSKVEKDILDVKRQFLPFEKELELMDTKIDLNNEQVLNLGKERELIQARTEKIDSEIALNNVSLDRLTVALDDDKFVYDQKLREDAKQENGELLTFNLQSQGELGAHIMSNILLKVGDAEYVSMMAILGSEPNADLTGDSDTLSDLLELKQFSYIKDDVSALISAYTMGRSDETVANWAPTIAMFDEIREGKLVFDSYVDGSALWQDMVNRNDFSANAMKKFEKFVKKDTTLTPIERMQILETTQWDKTGIFAGDNMEQFDKLDRTITQAKMLNEIKEQIHMVESDAALQTWHGQQTGVYPLTPNYTNVPFVNDPIDD